MQFGNPAQLFGKRRCIEQLPCCMCCSGAHRCVGGEDLSRRSGLAMSDHQVTHESDLTAGLQPLQRWLAHSRGHGESRGVVIVKTTGHAPCSARKADRRQDAGQLFSVIIKIDHEERIVAHQWIHRHEESRQGGGDRYGIV